MASAEVLANQVAFAAATVGELIEYRQGGGPTGKSIRATVRRRSRSSDGSDARDLVHSRVEIRLTRRASDGIPSVSVQKDRVLLKARPTDASPSTFLVARILYQNAGSWRLELEQ